MRKLVWLTDLHLVEPGRDPPGGIDPLTNLRACLEEVKAHHSDADRLVIGGDLIEHHNMGAYQILREELERLETPYRLLAGNHDDREALLCAFPEIESVDGFVQGGEELGGAHLLYLDTLTSGGKSHGELCPSRLRWISDRFRAAEGWPLLVFLHHPPCDIGFPALDRLRLRDSEPLADLMRGRTDPTHLFCGHVHRNVSGVWAGRPFSILKSLHAPFALNMSGGRLGRSAEPPGYGVVLFEGGDVVVHFRDVLVR